MHLITDKYDYICRFILQSSDSKNQHLLILWVSSSILIVTFFSPGILVGLQILDSLAREGG